MPNEHGILVGFSFFFFLGGGGVPLNSKPATLKFSIIRMGKKRWKISHWAAKIFSYTAGPRPQALQAFRAGGKKSESKEGSPI